VDEAGELSAAITKLNVTGCESGICSAVYLEISMENNTNVLYCVPSEYFSEYAADSLFIFYDGERDPIEHNGPSRYIEALESKDRGVYVNWLASQPNYVLQPGQKMAKTVYIKNVFAIAPRVSHATFQMFAFPCSKVEFGRRGYLKRVLESDLHFERANT
jgi:hypothetical protein